MGATVADPIISLTIWDRSAGHSYLGLTPSTLQMGGAWWRLGAGQQARARFPAFSLISGLAATPAIWIRRASETRLPSSRKCTKCALVCWAVDWVRHRLPSLPGPNHSAASAIIGSDPILSNGRVGSW